MVNRKLVKWQMQLDRGGEYALCDLCGKNYGSQMHEIVNRGRTVGNEAAREASYDKHICSLLCPECHTGSNLAESHEGDLIAFNMTLYSREAVLAAIKVVSDLLHTPLLLDIPEGEPL